MARIAGVNIPDRKHAWISLTAIYGIGPTLARKICAETGIEPSVQIKDLDEENLDKLQLRSARKDLPATSPKSPGNR